MSKEKTVWLPEVETKLVLRYGKMTWRKVAEELTELFPPHVFTREAVRRQFERMSKRWSKKDE